MKKSLTHLKGMAVTLSEAKTNYPKSASISLWTHQLRKTQREIEIIERRIFN